MYIYIHTSLNMYIYTYRSKHRPPTQTSGGCSQGGGAGWKRWRRASLAAPRALTKTTRECNLPKGKS